MIGLMASCMWMLTACSSTTNHDEHDANDASHEQETAEAEHHDDGEIVIDGHQAEQLGIRVKEVKTERFHTPVKVSGEVAYNPSNQSAIAAPMSGKITYSGNVTVGSEVKKGARIGTISAAGIAGGDPVNAARIEYDAALKEVERLKPLRADGIVTVGEYNAALTNLQRAKNNLSGGGGNVITAPLTGVITTLTAGEGTYVNMGDIIGTITGEGAMTLRVDVPSREAVTLGNVKSVKVKFPQMDEVIEATAVSGKNMVASSPGYVSLYYTLPPLNNVVAGSFAEVYIPTSDEREVITVPMSALTERMGKKMVYVKENGSDHYRRVAVETGASDGENVEVTGLDDGELVVVEGVTFVRLAENKGAVPPGHSHSH